MCKAAYSFDEVANLKDMTTVSPIYIYKKKNDWNVSKLAILY